MRMFALVLFVFCVDGEGSTGGVLQAGCAMVILLFNMVAHTFIQPYKDPRSNALETYCLLANILMLFLGMIGSIGIPATHYPPPSTGHPPPTTHHPPPQV